MEWDFRLQWRTKMELEPKNEGGEGEGKECSSFLPHPLPALLLALCFFLMTLIPHSFLRNHTEMLTMQFTVEVEPPESIPNAQIWWTFLCKKIKPLQNQSINKNIVVLCVLLE